MLSAVLAFRLSVPCEEINGLAIQLLPSPFPPEPPSPPPPPSSIEDSGGWPLFRRTLWSCWQRNLGGTSLDMNRCCGEVWLPDREEEGCPLATAIRCFALFPPLGGTCAETQAAPRVGGEGPTGPGLGETESGIAKGWEQEGLTSSIPEKDK